MNLVESDSYPLISIMIPVYNGINTIDFSIQSLLKQTFERWECIIINDGSDDGTKEYLEKLVDPRFKIYNFDNNKGRGFARQFALKNAIGKYIAFLDADDIYHPDKLNFQFNLLESNPELDLVTTGNASFNHNFEVLSVRGLGDGQKKCYKLEDNSFALRTSMLKLEVAKLGNFDSKLNYAEDQDYINQFMDGRYYINTNDILYYYSEFVSVSKMKIFKSYFFEIYRLFRSIRKSGIYGLYKIWITFFKVIAFILVSPFLNSQSIIAKRGRLPTDNEKSTFEKVVLDLK